MYVKKPKQKSYKPLDISIQKSEVKRMRLAPKQDIQEIPIVRTVIPSFPMEKKSQRQDTRTRKSVIKRLLPAQKQDIQGILTVRTAESF